MVDIAQAVTEWLRDVLVDVPIEYGQYPDTESDIRAMVKAAPGEPWIRRYKSGGGIKQFPYEVYLQTRPYSEGERIDGLAKLRAVQTAIENGGVIDGIILWAHDITTLPSPYSVSEDGVATCQLIAVVTYKV